MARVRRGLLHDRVRQLIRLGTGDVDVDAEHRRRVHERGRDVVAVADVGDRAAAQRPEPLLQREEVGERLAGMLLVGERVDRRAAAAAAANSCSSVLREGPDDHGVDPAFEVARDVGDRLAAAERDVGLQRDDMPAELADRDLERRPRAQRRLVEQHRRRAGRSRHRRSAPCRPSERSAFTWAASSQAALEIGGIEVEDREEILAR